MRLLILGGTAWLGRWVAETAAAAGHEVVCLARGEAGPPADGVELVRADRDASGAYDEVTGRSWDAVVDVSRQPGHVRRAAASLAGSTRTYVFVSSGNVYAAHATPGQDESAPLLPALAGDVMESMETYGEAKVACERAVLDAVGPRRTLIARAGLIGGPGDPFDRGGYWPWRFARPAADDGSVLVPDAADRPTQLLDVRDLAAWLVGAAAAGAYGVVNAVGETVPFGEHLGVARKVAGHSGPVVPAPEEWLLHRRVQPWMGERSLPLWLPDPSYAGFACRTGDAARELGLHPRPLEQTLADTLAWELSRPPAPRRAGLADADERELLAALAS